MRIRDERLPWLPDEPAPAAAAPAPVASAKGTARAMWPWYLLLLLLIAAVGAGAWWLGTRQREAPPPVLPAEEPLAIPMSEAQLPPPPVAAPKSPVAEQAPVAATPSVRLQPGRPVAEPEPDRTVEAERANGAEETVAAPTGRSVFPADEPTAVRAPATGPPPVVLTARERDRGRVVQLGAFPTRAQAETAWRRIVRRYPYLATKPKMVNTVEVRPLGGGRGTRMYRLQLGTSSQAQSAVICQQLERARQSCVVVY